MSHAFLHALLPPPHEIPTKQSTYMEDLHHQYARAATTLRQLFAYLSSIAEPSTVEMSKKVHSLGKDYSVQRSQERITLERSQSILREMSQLQIQQMSLSVETSLFSSKVLHTYLIQSTSELQLLQQWEPTIPAKLLKAADFTRLTITGRCRSLPCFLRTTSSAMRCGSRSRSLILGVVVAILRTADRFRRVRDEEIGALELL